MANEFKDFGPLLLERGFKIVPISPGKKSPSIGGWQENYIEDLSTWRRWVNGTGRRGPHGLGVVTGHEGVVAVDIDSTHPGLVNALVRWCNNHIGATAMRIGQAPKTLLVYRDWGASRKKSSSFFIDEQGQEHRLEILATGQQFVAYADHPGTHRPYEWVDLIGGLTEYELQELPVLTPVLADQLIAVFTQGAQRLHWTEKRSFASSSRDVAGDDPFAGFEGPLGKSEDELREIIQWLDPEDYDVWVRVGMALHHEYGGGGDGLTLWDEWSQPASNYTGLEALEYRWGKFGQGRSASITVRSLISAANEKRREAERDEHRETRRRLRVLVEQCADSVELLGPVARDVGQAVASSPAMRAELLGLIRARFRDLTGQNVALADIRKATRQESTLGSIAGPTRRERTEFGNAERLLDRYGEGLIYVPEIGVWHRWAESHWRACDTTYIEHMAKETVRALPAEVETLNSDEERESFYKFCAASQRVQMIKNMVTLACSDPRVSVPFSHLNQKSYLLAAKNRVIDLRTGEDLPPDPKYYLTVSTSTPYDPEAEAPVFKQTVSDVFFGDDAMVAFFQRLIGYAVLGDPKEDLLVIPYGTGSNGKSTLFGAIREALGGHAMAANADTFLSDGRGAGAAGAAREDILRLRGSRFVYVGEPEEDYYLKEGLIKAMTGGDPMPARGLWSKSTVEVIPTWCAFMPTNHKPIIKGDDHAIWRRILPVPFVRNFDKDDTIQKDAGRADKLRAELPGILRWCVEGALQYQALGLQPPAAVRAARDSYREDMDLLRDWLDSCCEIRSDAFASIQLLWASWERYAREQGDLAYIRNSRALGRRLASRFTSAKRGGKRGYLGLQLKPDLDFD